MTDQQINAAIAEITGSNKLVGLKKRGLWWRPNAHGYTYNESEAWRITEEEAKKYARPNDVDAVTIERFNPSDYCNDLNAMHEAEKAMDDKTHYDFCHKHLQLVATRGTHVKSMRACISSTARQRAEALLRALGKWEEAGCDR